MSSSRGYTFHESEKAVIDKLRQWAHDYFRGTEIFDNSTHLNQREYMASDGQAFFKDFDFIGKLLDIQWIDD
jgi:hypothetical protein